MKEKKIRQKLLSILMAAAMILVQLPVTAFAATVGENSRPGTYTGTAEGFGGETVTVQLTVDEDHKISGITASSSRTADTAEGGDSATFWKNALIVLESIKAANGTDGVNAVSGATYSSTAMINAANAALVSAGNVYVSGSGSDDGDGSPEAPAATFAKAKELLGGNAGTIYVSSTINVTGEESWTLAEGQSLARADGFTGALVSVAEGGKLTLSSITVDGREIEGVDSPLVTVAEGGSLTVEAGAVLEHNLSSKAGGAVVCNGTMTMTGGEIRGNAAASGGAVSLGGAFIMEGGSIHDNTASGTGAGIDAFRADSITLNGGSIKNNEAESNGGGVYIFLTKLNVGADASIIANKAADGAGIYGWMGTIAMTGGSVRSNKATGENGVGGINGMLRGFTVSGDVIISGNTDTAGKNSNTAVNFTINGAMGGDASIYVTADADTAFASGSGDYKITEGDAGHFFSDVSGLVPALDTENNSIKFETEPGAELLDKVYLNGISGDGAADGRTPETAVKTFAQAKALLAEDGTIYVTDMITVTGQETWSLADKGSAKIARDESYIGEEPEEGHDYVNGPLVEVNGFRASLTLEDVVLDGANIEAMTGLVTVKSGSLKINDGAVLENAVGLQHNGGGLYIYGDGSVTMNGGIIRNNFSAGYGGGVFNNGEFDLRGGSITGNSAGYSVGGVHNNASMTMSGTVVIRDNVLVVGSTSTPANLYMASGKYVVIDGALESGSEISADSYVKPANIARGTDSYTITSDDLSRFGLDDKSGTYILTLDGNAINLRLTAQPSANAVYLDPASGSDTNGGKAEGGAVKSLEKAIEIARAGGAEEIYVMGVITVTDARTWDDIKLTRYFTYLGELVRVADGGSLTLNGVILDGGKKSGLSANRPLIMVDKGGSLAVGDGSVLKNNSSLMEGGAVYNVGEMKLCGGTISGNDTQDGNDGGGGIFNENGGTLTIESGFVENNEAYAGAGVENEGHLIIKGGTIRNNTARGGGAGVHVWAEGGNTSFTMTGGSITGNVSTENNGGGLFIWQGSATISGGSISGNKAYGTGGIYVYGVVYVSGDARICDNTTEDGGQANAAYMGMTQTAALGKDASIGTEEIGDVAAGGQYVLTDEDAAHYTSDLGHRLYLDTDRNVICVAPTGVSLESDKISLAAGGSTTVGASASLTYGFTDKTLKYRSSDENIVKIDENGRLTGVSSGTAAITITNAYGETATCTVTVYENSSGSSGSSGSGSSTTPVKKPVYFKDVPAGAYYAEAVKWAVEKGITEGLSEIRFAPDVHCTRAQAVTFLWRAMGSPKPAAGDMPFEDVAGTAYYHDAVLWAVEKGITNGVSETRFDLNAECTRAQIVTLLWRARGSRSSDADISFDDVPSDAYYAEAVRWAADGGVTLGTSASAFSPDEGCTRGQIVTFIYRCMK